MKKFLAIAIMLIPFFLSACGNNADEFIFSTGPSVNVLNIVNIGVHANTRGEIVVEGDVSVPLISAATIAGVNWDFAFEKVLREASYEEYKLFLMWEKADGDIVEEIYDIGKPFQITFQKSEWVRKIVSTGDSHNIVVFIEKQAMVETSGSQNTSKPTTVQNCPGVNWKPRVEVGQNVRICTIYRLILRDRPDGNEIIALFWDNSIRIIDGPACGKDSWWWKVEVPQSSKYSDSSYDDYEDYSYTDYEYVGWVKEGLDRPKLPESNGYFLCP